MNALQKTLLFGVLLCTAFSWAQQDRIIISEEKKGKRIVLKAENTTDETLNIFVLINANGYRRSADKPILIDVPAKRKIPLATLIAIDEPNASYTYELIINDKLDNTKDISYTKAASDISRVIEGKLVMFSKAGCDRCKRLEEELTYKRIDFRNFNLDEDPILYKQFMAFIESSFTEKTQIRFPVIWNKTEAIFGYDELEDVMTELSNQ
ncbi:MAG: glutaredoxin family protein [Patiriisocius sp.]|uniref:glutaredoxin family protein n=1 Tax=Patiriisocius sp. TaxID=2822396 RepID=UPI003EF757D5